MSSSDTVQIEFSQLSTQSEEPYAIKEGQKQEKECQQVECSPYWKVLYEPEWPGQQPSVA